MKKKLLILAGAAVHMKVVETAKAMGIYTIVTDYLNVADSPAKQIADEAWNLNIMDVDAIVDKCKEERVDGVLSFCIDPAQRPYQQICEKLNFPCYCTKEQLDIMTDKKAFKRFCVENDVDVIKEYSNPDANIEYPVLVKPAISRGSRGQTVCNDKSELIAAIKVAEKESANNEAIIEQYMGGCQDFAISYLVVNGTPYLTKIGDRYLGKKEDKLNKQCIATVSPSKFTDIYVKEIEPKVKRMISKLGIKFGPVFLQGFIDGNRVRFYDPGLRFPGGDFDLILRDVTGFDTIRSMINFSLTGNIESCEGNPFDAYRLKGKIGIQLTLSARPGLIGTYEGTEEIASLPYVLSVSKRYKTDECIPDGEDVRRRVIEILILAPDSARAATTVKAVYDRLRVLDKNGKDMMVSLLDPKVLRNYGRKDICGSDDLKDIAWELSKYFSSIEKLPEYVIDQTKLFIVDYIASEIAGYRVNEANNRAVIELIRENGGKEEASVLFEEKKYPAINAAFANAFYSHGADMDDGNKKSQGHIATHVMSSVFALAEIFNVTWRDVFLAINVGYEAFNRIGGAAQPDLYNKGFHSTGVVGALAAAAACAKLLGLDAYGIYSAISLAAIQAGGLIIIDESGQSCKPINPANAAHIGVLSALLAQKGVKSSRFPLNSKKGWFNGFSKTGNAERALDGIGEDGAKRHFTICESYLKLYPSCRHTHGAIEAAIKMRKHMAERNEGLRDIKKIKLIVYPSAIKSCGSISHPDSADEAKFSLSYCYAVALCRSSFTIDDIEQIHHEEEIERIIGLTLLEEDPALENRRMGIRGTKVQAEFSSGYVYSIHVENPKGEKSNPLSWNDLREKMNMCVGNLQIDTDSIVNVVKNINQASNYETWTKWLT